MIKAIATTRALSKFLKYAGQETESAVKWLSKEFGYGPERAREVASNMVLPEITRQHGRVMRELIRAPSRDFMPLTNLEVRRINEPGKIVSGRFIRSLKLSPSGDIQLPKSTQRGLYSTLDIWLDPKHVRPSTIWHELTHLRQYVPEAVEETLMNSLRVLSHRIEHTLSKTKGGKFYDIDPMEVVAKRVSNAMAPSSKTANMVLPERFIDVRMSAARTILDEYKRKYPEMCKELGIPMVAAIAGLTAAGIALPEEAEAGVGSKMVGKLIKKGRLRRVHDIKLGKSMSEELWAIEADPMTHPILNTLPKGWKKEDVLEMVAELEYDTPPYLRKAGPATEKEVGRSLRQLNKGIAEANEIPMIRKTAEQWEELGRWMRDNELIEHTGLETGEILMGSRTWKDLGPKGAAVGKVHAGYTLGLGRKLLNQVEDVFAAKGRRLTPDETSEILSDLGAKGDVRKRLVKSLIDSRVLEHPGVKRAYLIGSGPSKKKQPGDFDVLIRGDYETLKKFDTTAMKIDVGKGMEAPDWLKDVEIVIVPSSGLGEVAHVLEMAAIGKYRYGKKYAWKRLAGVAGAAVAATLFGGEQEAEAAPVGPIIKMTERIGRQVMSATESSAAIKLRGKLVEGRIIKDVVKKSKNDRMILFEDGGVQTVDKKYLNYLARMFGTEGQMDKFRALKDDKSRVDMALRSLKHHKARARSVPERLTRAYHQDYLRSLKELGESMPPEAVFVRHEGKMFTMPKEYADLLSDMGVVKIIK